MGSTTQENGLKVGIVGAGVAGLCAAIALRRAGHECEIYERSQFRNEVGAAVSIPPNGGRILKRWGFDSVQAQGIDMIQVRRPKGSDLTPMAPTIDFSNVEQKYGNRWFFYHRVDMHKQLREMAASDAFPGKPAVIRLGCQVMDVDPEQGTIHLKDGTQVQKDLVIIADGQHDRLNAKITGVDIPMQRSGQTAYRCLIPMKDILADEVTRPLFENEAHGFWAPALPPKGVMCVTYPCRNGEILNCLIVHRKLGQHASGEDEQTIEDWNFPATPEQLEAVLDGFHPAVRTLMLKSPDIKMYTQMKRQPLPKMFKGKALLIGDACHPMLLTHAQGVSSSIEDSAALEIMFSNLHGSKSVSDAPSAALTTRLELFEKFRLPRVSATQIMTDPIPPGPKAAELYVKMEAEIRKHYDGPLPPPNSVPHSPAICDFFFGYDVTAEAEKIMATQHLDALEKEVNQLSLSSGQQKKEADVTVTPTAPTTASVPLIVTAPNGTAADKMAETNVTEVPNTPSAAENEPSNGNATLGKDLTVKNLYLRLKKSLSFDSLRKRNSMAAAKTSGAA